MKIWSSLLCFFLIFACAGILLSRLDTLSEDGAAAVGSPVIENGDSSSWIVAVDAGHGGNDPGKVGEDGVMEKDINLAIAMDLKEALEESGIKVIMTRENDTGLYSAGASNKKAEDMKNRIAVIEESGADILISIHQNSFTQPQYHGAQVFFYTGSDSGEKLADAVQENLIKGADPDNTRQAKANSDYYLLKNSSIPAVICECGFLSNPEECARLASEEYQKTIAGCIAQGIMEYLSAYS